MDAQGPMVAIPRLDVGRGPACWGMSRLHRYGPSLHVETNLNSRTYRPRKLREGTADLGPEYKPREGGSGSRMSKQTGEHTGRKRGRGDGLSEVTLSVTSNFSAGRDSCVCPGSWDTLTTFVTKPGSAAHASRSCRTLIRSPRKSIARQRLVPNKIKITEL